MADSSITYFVPGLPDSIEEEQLRQHFSKYGQVIRAEVARQRGSGSSRGNFAYVTMADESSRDQIVTDLHDFGDRPVRVLLNKESLHSPEAKKVHLGHLGHHIMADQIREAFSTFGTVLDVHTPKDPRTGERKNYGFVTLGSDDSFAAAIAEGQIQVGDCMVTIKPSAQSKGEEVFRGPKAGGACSGKGMGKGYDDPWGMGNGMAGYGWGGKGYSEWDPYGWGGKGGDKGGCAAGGDSAGDTRKDGRGGVKYFVPGLPDTVTDEELQAHFSFYGTVLDAAVVTEKGSEQSRGFGYVTMADGANREALLTDRHDLGGKQINIMLTKDSLTGSDVKKVHLGKLREDVSADAIRDVFQRFGVVLDVHTPKDPKTGERKNFGFVTFGTQEAFDAAVNAGSAVVESSKVTIKPAAQSRQDDDGGMGMGMPPPMMGKGKGFDPWSSPSWGPPPGKGWGFDGYGGKGWGSWDAWGGGWGPAWGGKGMWDGKGWGGPGMWGGKGGWDDPYGAKGGKWGGKGADPWGGKGGDPWSGKGGAESWGSKGDGKSDGKDGRRSEGGAWEASGWSGSGAGEKGKGKGAEAEASPWAIVPATGCAGKGQGGGGYEDQWGGKGKGASMEDPWAGGKGNHDKGGSKGGKGDHDQWGGAAASWNSGGGPTESWEEPGRGSAAEWDAGGGGIPSGYGPQRLSPGSRGGPYTQP